MFVFPQGGPVCNTTMCPTDVSPISNTTSYTVAQTIKIVTSKQTTTSTSITASTPAISTVTTVASIIPQVLIRLDSYHHFLNASATLQFFVTQLYRIHVVIFEILTLKKKKSTSIRQLNSAHL